MKEVTIPWPNFEDKVQARRFKFINGFCLQGGYMRTLDARGLTVALADDVSPEKFLAFLDDLLRQKQERSDQRKRKAKA